MKKYSFLLVLSFLIFSCTPPTSVPPVPVLPKAQPADVGLKAENFEQVDQMFQSYIDDKKLAGSVAIVLKDGKVVHFKAYGHQDKEANLPMQNNTIFRIASMTKAITSLAILILEDEGKLKTDDLVSKYIPEMKNPKVFGGYDADSSVILNNAKNEVKISHLLTHTTGIGYSFMSPLAQELYSKAQIPDGSNKFPIKISQTMPKLAQQPLFHEPGEKFTYGLSTDMLGYVVEVASGMELDEFLKKKIFEPLDMDDTYFFLPEEKYGRLAQHYVETKEHGVVPVTAVDKSGNINFPIDGAKSYFSGGGGLCSTAFDYARFLQMVLNNGELNGKRVISEKTIQKMKTNQIGDIPVFGNPNAGYTFGFEYQKVEGKGERHRPKGRLGWGGLFGTHYWMNPSQNMAAVLMTQTYPQPTRDEIYAKFEGLMNTSVK